MSAQQTSQLLRSAPYFPVADVEQSVAHYERVFGFQREYLAGTPPEFAILSRDGLPIMLRRVPTTERIIPNEKQGGTWDAFFWIRDARALHPSSPPPDDRKPFCRFQSGRSATTGVGSDLE
jgi:hypothetical protein